MLNMIMEKKRLKLNGLIGFYPANSVGDDIEVCADETRGTKSHTFHTLRQQAEKDVEEPYMALSDFIAPKASGVKDYLGMFVATAGIGLDELTAEYKAANDDYSYIMAEALADRLAEALAELMHEQVRKDHWGLRHGREVQLRRPAEGEKVPGHPPGARLPVAARPHREGHDVGADEGEGDRRGAHRVLRHASLRVRLRLLLRGQSSQYFNVGKVTSDQVKEYADRKGQDFKTAEKWLSPILSYEP